MNDLVKKRAVPQFFDHLLTEKLVIDEAPEPTDIIWENRHFSNGERNSKALIVGLIIFVLLVISAMILFHYTV